MAESDDEKSVPLRPVGSPFHSRDIHDDMTTDDDHSSGADDADHVGTHDPPSEPRSG